MGNGGYSSDGGYSGDGRYVVVLVMVALVAYLMAGIVFVRSHRRRIHAYFREEYPATYRWEGVPGSYAGFVLVFWPWYVLVFYVGPLMERLVGEVGEVGEVDDE